MGIENISVSLFTISLTYIFLFWEQSQQEDNKVNVIY